MRYEGNPKHKEPWQPGRRGSLCPKELSQAQVEALLRESELEGDKRYAIWNELPFVAQQHGSDAWHGYPIAWSEVPEALRRRWRATGKVRRSSIRRFWDRVDGETR